MVTIIPLRTEIGLRRGGTLGISGATVTPVIPAFDARAMNEAHRHAAHDQLERMLANPLFKHSKRYPALLRYVVEHALDGHNEQIKEPTLGIEVFGREPGYDTNLDPVVRTTAGEIRKRIAQYYHEPGHEYELRIEMPSGTYIPEFHAPPERMAIMPAPAEVPAPAAAPVARRWQMPVVIA